MQMGAKQAICVFLILFYMAPASLAVDKGEKGKKTNDSAGSVASYELSGQAQLLSHFIVRGLSYSDNNPAMNASFLANLGSQVKFGFWGSNISNLSFADDNFWFKIFTEVKMDLGNKLYADFFLDDNNFYKSNNRNGQNIGLKFYRNLYEFGAMWMSNLEGTRSNSEYLWVGTLIDYKKGFQYGVYSGITFSHTSSIHNYMDFKIIGQYIVNANAGAEAGVTFNSIANQFGVRDDPAVYIAIRLAY